MKAEHRKELETNTLADRMGRLLETAKQKPQGGTVLWIFFGVGVLVVTFLVIRWYGTGKAENSDGWESLYRNDYKGVLETHPDKIQGQAVRFDIAWEQLWVGGIRKLGVDPKGAKEGMLNARKQYEKLLEECEGDPVLVPEAIYSLGVIEETLAIDDRSHLDGAIDYYEDASKKFPQSAYGQLAKNRLETLQSDEGRKEVNTVYQDLQRLIDFGRFDRKNLLTFMSDSSDSKET